MNQTLIKNVNIWTMDEEDTRFTAGFCSKTAKSRPWAKANRLQCRVK